MDVITTTPFGQRPITATLMKHARAARAPAPVAHVGKWELFRQLCTARKIYGVTDRDLTVLNALLTFHKDTNLADDTNLVVFPSNRTLSERVHGMAESTLRRHLAALVNAGLICRHDSPNGKRYAARAPEGGILRAFGFDLRPLLVQAPDIARTATEVSAAQAQIKRLREDISLQKRDALKLASYGQDHMPARHWDGLQETLLGIHKQMRRKLNINTLEGLKQALNGLLGQIRTHLETEEMSSDDIHIERHHSNSQTDSYESEKDLEEKKEPQEIEIVDRPTLPLNLVLKACPDILPYAKDTPRHWHELIALSSFVRSMMGISADGWTQAQRIMGPEVAAITVAGILQRVSEIKSPGGYLRALTRKAEKGKFSPAPMILALLQPGGETRPC